MIARLAISLLLAGSLIFAVIVFIELQPASDDPPSLSATGAEPRNPGVAAMRRQPSSRMDELLAVVLARPLFSSTRRPPQNAGNDAPSADLGDARLTGIITEPGHNLAIFAVNGSRPLRLTEGEAVSGWRIESITPREVSLSGPAGTKTLEPKADPSLVAPAPALANPAVRPPGQPAPTAAAPRPGIAPPRPGAMPAGMPPPQPRPVGGR